MDFSLPVSPYGADAATGARLVHPGERSRRGEVPPACDLLFETLGWCERAQIILNILHRGVQPLNGVLERMRSHASLGHRDFDVTQVVREKLTHCWAQGEVLSWERRFVDVNERNVGAKHHLERQLCRVRSILGCQNNHGRRRHIKCMILAAITASGTCRWYYVAPVVVAKKPSRQMPSVLGVSGGRVASCCQICVVPLPITPSPVG